MSDLPSKDGLKVVSISAVRQFTDRSLDELRMEDYFAVKSNAIPDNIMSRLKTKWEANIKSQSSPIFGGSILGNNNSGGMNSLFGVMNNQNQSGNSLVGNSGGGLFNQSRN